MWPVVERGHRLRARPADAAGRDPLGPPRRRHAVVVRPAHRLVVDLPQPALRHRHRRAARPRAARLGAVGRPPGPRHRATCPTRVRPQGPLGDGLVLPGAGRRADRRRRPASACRGAGHTLRACDGRGRALRRRPAVGHRRRDVRVRARPPRPSATRDAATDAVRAGRSSCATDDGRYWTGIVFPERGPLPRRRALDLHRRRRRAGRRRAWPAASPASGLFTRHDDVLPVRFDGRRRRPGADQPVNDRD